MALVEIGSWTERTRSLPSFLALFNYFIMASEKNVHYPIPACFLALSSVGHCITE